MSPWLEPLEKRQLLASDATNVFATFDGTIASVNGTVAIPISLTSGNFNLGSGKVVLGFQLEASSGSTLAPIAVQIRNSANNLIQPIYTNSKLTNGTQSLSVDQLAYGNYTMTAGAQGGTSGAYHLVVFLAGDANGDRSVNAADLTLIQKIYGSKAGDGKYTVAADANLDGLISSFDFSQTLTDQGDSTKINPLTASIALSPSPHAIGNGTLVTNSTEVTVSGFTEPGATVQLGTGSDSTFGEGTTTADSSGHYSFSVALAAGSNEIQTRSTDSFGQSRIASIQVSLDTAPPTIALSSPANGLLTNSNVTVSGGVTDDLSGVASLMAQVDGGDPFAVSFDSAGHFSFPTTFLLNGTNDGMHSISLVATDSAGNVSGPAAVDFSLDTIAPAQP